MSRKSLSGLAPAGCGYRPAIAPGIGAAAAQFSVCSPDTPAWARLIGGAPG